MYEACYGLRERPFELTANPQFLFLPPRQRETLSSLQYGLASARSITVLIGEAGTGKSTLLRAALESERCRNVRCVYISNPTLALDDFVRTLAARFELGSAAAISKAAFLNALEHDLRERRAHGEITALVVDEAQSLSTGLLEEVRLLANIETPTQKLLPLVLAGQPELGRRLEEPALRQLKQRVALRCETGPLDMAETAGYIGTRVHRAGGSPQRLFSREAVVEIFQLSGGIPRTINVICDNALVTGMALGGKTVTKDMVTEVCGDLALRRRTEPAGVGSPAPRPSSMRQADHEAGEDQERYAEPAGAPARVTVFTSPGRRGAAGGAS